MDDPDMFSAYARTTAPGYLPPAETPDPRVLLAEAYGNAIRNWSASKQRFDDAYQQFTDANGELRRAESHMHAIAAELEYQGAAGGMRPPAPRPERVPDDHNQPPIANGTLVVPVVRAGHFAADPPPSSDGLNASEVVRTQLEQLQRNGNG